MQGLTSLFLVSLTLLLNSNVDGAELQCPFKTQTPIQPCDVYECTFPVTAGDIGVSSYAEFDFSVNVTGVSAQVVNPSGVTVAFCMNNCSQVLDACQVDEVGNWSIILEANDITTTSFFEIDVIFSTVTDTSLTLGKPLSVSLNWTETSGSFPNNADYYVVDTTQLPSNFTAVELVLTNMQPVDAVSSIITNVVNEQNAGTVRVIISECEFQPSKWSIALVHNGTVNANTLVNYTVEVRAILPQIRPISTTVNNVDNPNLVTAMPAFTYETETIIFSFSYNKQEDITQYFNMTAFNVQGGAIQMRFSALSPPTLLCNNGRINGSCDDVEYSCSMIEQPCEILDGNNTYYISATALRLNSPLPITWDLVVSMVDTSFGGEFFLDYDTPTSRRLYPGGFHVYAITQGTARSTASLLVNLYTATQQRSTLLLALKPSESDSLPGPPPCYDSDFSCLATAPNSDCAVQVPSCITLDTFEFYVAVWQLQNEADSASPAVLYTISADNPVAEDVDVDQFGTSPPEPFLYTGTVRFGFYKHYVLHLQGAAVGDLDFSVQDAGTSLTAYFYFEEQGEDLPQTFLAGEPCDSDDCYGYQQKSTVSFNNTLTVPIANCDCSYDTIFVSLFGAEGRNTPYVFSFTPQRGPYFIDDTLFSGEEGETVSVGPNNPANFSLSVFGPTDVALVLVASSRSDAAVTVDWYQSTDKTLFCDNCRELIKSCSLDSDDAECVIPLQPCELSREYDYIIVLISSPNDAIVSLHYTVQESNIFPTFLNSDEPVFATVFTSMYQFYYTDVDSFDVMTAQAFSAGSNTMHLFLNPQQISSLPGAAPCFSAVIQSTGNPAYATINACASPQDDDVYIGVLPKSNDGFDQSVVSYTLVASTFSPIQQLDPNDPLEMSLAPDQITYHTYFFDSTTPSNSPLSFLVVSSVQDGDIIATLSDEIFDEDGEDCACFPAFSGPRGIHAGAPAQSFALPCPADGEESGGITLKVQARNSTQLTRYIVTMRKLKPDTRSIYTNGTEIRIELPVGDYSTFQLMTDPLTNITQSSGLSIEVINVDGGVVDVYWTTESPSVSLDCSAAKQLCSAGGQNGDCSTVVSPCDEPLVGYLVVLPTVTETDKMVTFTINARQLESVTMKMNTSVPVAAAKSATGATVNAVSRYFFNVTSDDTKGMTEPALRLFVQNLNVTESNLSIGYYQNSLCTSSGSSICRAESCVINVSPCDLLATGTIVGEYMLSLQFLDPQNIPENPTMIPTLEYDVVDLSQAVVPSALPNISSVVQIEQFGAVSYAITVPTFDASETEMSLTGKISLSGVSASPVVVLLSHESQTTSRNCPQTVDTCTLTELTRDCTVSVDACCLSSLVASSPKFYMSVFNQNDGIVNVTGVELTTSTVGLVVQTGIKEQVNNVTVPWSPYSSSPTVVLAYGVDVPANTLGLDVVIENPVAVGLQVTLMYGRIGSACLPATTGSVLCAASLQCIAAFPVLDSCFSSLLEGTYYVSITPQDLEAVPTMNSTMSVYFKTATYLTAEVDRKSVNVSAPQNVSDSTITSVVVVDATTAPKQALSELIITVDADDYQCTAQLAGCEDSFPCAAPLTLCNRRAEDNIVYLTLSGATEYNVTAEISTPDVVLLDLTSEAGQVFNTTGSGPIYLALNTTVIPTETTLLSLSFNDVHMNVTQAPNPQLTIDFAYDSLPNCLDTGAANAICTPVGNTSVTNCQWTLSSCALQQQTPSTGLLTLKVSFSNTVTNFTLVSRLSAAVVTNVTLSENAPFSKSVTAPPNTLSYFVITAETLASVPTGMGLQVVLAAECGQSVMYSEAGVLESFACLGVEGANYTLSGCDLLRMQQSDIPLSDVYFTVLTTTPLADGVNVRFTVTAMLIGSPVQFAPLYNNNPVTLSSNSTWQTQYIYGLEGGFSSFGQLVLRIGSPNPNDEVSLFASPSSAAPTSPLCANPFFSCTGVGSCEIRLNLCPNGNLASLYVATNEPATDGTTITATATETSAPEFQFVISDDDGASYQNSGVVAVNAFERWWVDLSSKVTKAGFQAMFELVVTASEPPASPVSMRLDKDVPYTSPCTNNPEFSSCIANCQLVVDWCNVPADGAVFATIMQQQGNGGAANETIPYTLKVSTMVADVTSVKPDDAFCVQMPLESMDDDDDDGYYSADDDEGGERPTQFRVQPVYYDMDTAMPLPEGAASFASFTVTNLMGGGVSASIGSSSVLATPQCSEKSVDITGSMTLRENCASVENVQMSVSPNDLQERSFEITFALDVISAFSLPMAIPVAVATASNSSIGGVTYFVVDAPPRSSNNSHLLFSIIGEGGALSRKYDISASSTSYPPLDSGSSCSTTPSDLIDCKNCFLLDLTCVQSSKATPIYVALSGADVSSGDMVRVDVISPSSATAPSATLTVQRSSDVLGTSAVATITADTSKETLFYEWIKVDISTFRLSPTDTLSLNLELSGFAESLWWVGTDPTEDQPFSINIAGAHRSKVLLVSGCNLASLSELYVFVVMASTQTCQNVMITAQAVVEPSSETPTSVLSFASYPRTGVLLPIPANNITLTSGLMVTHPIQWFAYNVTSSSASDADDDDEMVIMVQITNDHVTVDAWPNFIPSFLDDRGPSCTTIVEPGAGWPYILAPCDDTLSYTFRVAYPDLTFPATTPPQVYDYRIESFTAGFTQLKTAPIDLRTDGWPTLAKATITGEGQWLSVDTYSKTDVVIASSLPCDVESEILLSVTCYGPCSVPYPRPVNVDTLSSTVYIYVNYVASQQSNAAANGTIQWSAGQAALCKPVDSDFCGSFYSVQKVVDTDALDMVAASLSEELYNDLFCSTSGCGVGSCRDVSDSCQSALKRYACSTVYPMCDTEGFLQPLCESDCINIEEECGISLDDPEFANDKLDCNHNYYGTCQRTVAPVIITPTPQTPGFPTWAIITLSVVGGLLVLLVVAGAAGGGYYYYHRKKLRSGYETI